MKAVTSVFLLAVTVLLVLSCDSASIATEPPSPAADSSRPAVQASAGCGMAVSSGSSTGQVASAGVTRGFRLHVPKGYDPDRPTPLVLNFHGFGSNAVQQEVYSGLADQSDAAGFILVTPEGSGSPQRWYFIDFPGAEVDDFAFVRSLIDYLSRNLCVDPARIYATGMSNGGFMSAALACELSDVFAAVAPVAGVVYSPACDGARPVAVAIFHGTDDKVVPFAGGNIGLLPTALPGVREAAAGWARHNGCDALPATKRIASDVTLDDYSGCTDDAGVRLYVIEGGGHTWPGAPALPFLDTTTESIKAAAVIWQFFEDHTKD